MENPEPDKKTPSPPDWSQLSKTVYDTITKQWPCIIRSFIVAIYLSIAAIGFLGIADFFSAAKEIDLPKMAGTAQQTEPTTETDAAKGNKPSKETKLTLQVELEPKTPIKVPRDIVFQSITALTVTTIALVIALCFLLAFPLWFVFRYRDYN